MYTIKDKLKIAWGFFETFDVDKNGMITSDEVGPLLRETYKSMGKNYNPTFHDYEKLIELSLLKSGIYAEKWIIIYFYA